ncbi:hypothetical protein HS125_00315 [bacterium]|nr:hypothetical protein [bacterium]
MRDGSYFHLFSGWAWARARRHRRPDGNGTIDHRDVFLFALAWGTTGTSIADLDGDGIVAGTDLVGLVEVAQGGVFPSHGHVHSHPYAQPDGYPDPTATPTPTPTGPVYPYYDLEDYRIHPAEINDNRNPRLAIQSDAEMIVLWAARATTAARPTASWLNS